MLREPGRPWRELNRLDIKNRSPLPAAAEERLLSSLAGIWERIDALLVLDQVTEAGCGVVTARVRDMLGSMGTSNPGKTILADSRRFIGQFRSVWLKPNRDECRQALGETIHVSADHAALLAERAGCPVFCTQGEQGIQLVDPRSPSRCNVRVPAYRVTGPIDIVGAGDSTSAAIACAVAGGARLEEAAAFGNLIASITIQQIGTTGTASPDQVRHRWRQLRAQTD
jgi:bifunctional ADP-heptose synthase (sugar kinase/adenylyltransferase)